MWSVLDDPWHEETLRALLTYLGEMKRGVRALVVTSSDAVASQVEEAIRKEFVDREIVDLRAGSDADPVDVFTPVVRSEPRPGRLVFVKDLAANALHYINLNRELFDREGEAFVFAIMPDMARDISKKAADFGRYAQSFEFEVLTETPSLETILRNIEGTTGDIKFKIDKYKSLKLVYSDSPMEVEIFNEEQVDAMETFFPFLRHRDIVSVLTDIVRDSGFKSYNARARALLAEISVHSGDLHAVFTLFNKVEEMNPALVYGVKALGLRAAGNITESLIRCIEAEAHDAEVLGAITVDILLHQWSALVASGRLWEARQILEESARYHLDDSQHRDHSFLEFKATSLYWMGALASSCDMLRAFLASIGDKRRSADWYYQGLIVAGRLKEAAGSPRESLAFFEECASEEHRQERILIWFEARGALGENLLTLGHTTRATECLRETLATARDLGYGLFVPDLELSLGRAKDAAGRMDEALGHYHSALRKALEMGKALVAADGQRHLGRIYRLQGKTELAEFALTTALATERHSGARAHETRTLTELSHLARDQGEAKAAQSYARDALDVLRETRFRIDEPAALAAQAAAYQAAGRGELAEPIHGRWRRLVNGIRATGLREWIERALGGREKQGSGQIKS